MTFSYFPGCTLRTKAAELDQYARLSARALGFCLEEIPDWQCCGGTYPLARDEIATKLSSVRALVSARDAGRDLVTLCSACHNVIKQVNGDMRNDADIASRANRYLGLEKPYYGETNVIHYLEVLRDKIGFDEIARRVTKPFTGKKIGAYYGCLLLRPGKVMQMDNPENPKILEDFIRAIGAEPVVYAMRNECCGGYATIEDGAFAAKKSGAVLANAEDSGAELLVPACPLCLYNLGKTARDARAGGAPGIVYFTELLARALGLVDPDGNADDGDAVAGNEPADGGVRKEEPAYV
jgi:heterodisulfide reductase subunit B